jgi:hypothetical protein
MADTEQAERFMNPPRTFPKKKKEKPKLILDGASLKRQMRYNDKNASEHDKAMSSLGSLLFYYKDRANEAVFENPDIKRRVAVSIKEEKSKRVNKSKFLKPKNLEQIENYVTRITSDSTLKKNENADIQRRILLKTVELDLRRQDRELKG